MKALNSYQSGIYKSKIKSQSLVSLITFHFLKRTESQNITTFDSDSKYFFDLLELLEFIYSFIYYSNTSYV